MRTMRKERGERAMLGKDDRLLMRLVDEYEKERKIGPGLTVDEFIRRIRPPAHLHGRLKAQLQSSNLLAAAGAALRKHSSSL